MDNMLRFEYTSTDKRFYKEHLAGRLPSSIVDEHVHLNLPEHVRNVSEERLRSDWALEAGHILTVREVYESYKILLPETQVKIIGMPWPIKEADIIANNQYLAEEAEQKRVHPLMTIRPEWSSEDVERYLINGGFKGFKPYGDMVSGVKGADLSIFDFMPHSHLKIADKYGKVVLLHLPRRGRLPDPDNIQELLEIREAYQNIKLIVAHFGRCFNPCYLKEGVKKLGDTSWFYFDCAAVLNPEIYDLALDFFSPDQIMFGSDLPITFLRGKREWTETGYINYARGDYSWNTNRKSPKEEAGYTLFIYEQFKAILDAMDRARIDSVTREKIFHGNAAGIFGLMEGENVLRKYKHKN